MRVRQIIKGFTYYPPVWIIVFLGGGCFHWKISFSFPKMFIFPHFLLTLSVKNSYKIINMLYYRQCRSFLNYYPIIFLIIIIIIHNIIRFIAFFFFLKCLNTLQIVQWSNYTRGHQYNNYDNYRISTVSTLQGILVWVRRGWKIPNS